MVVMPWWRGVLGVVFVGGRKGRRCFGGGDFMVDCIVQQVILKGVVGVVVDLLSWCLVLLMLTDDE